MFLIYDNVGKFLAERFSRDFANWLLNEPIQLTELKPTELSLNPIRADSLIFLQSEEIVLHIEFQTCKLSSDLNTWGLTVLNPYKIL